MKDNLRAPSQPFQRTAQARSKRSWRKDSEVVPAPDAKTAPLAGRTSKSGARAKKAAPRDARKRLRMMLLVVLPLIALSAGATFYLMGGRYISTDNAYVGAQKVLITPDISGKIIHVAVVEGQHVKPGDELFTIDAEPYRTGAAAGRGQARRRAQRV